MKFINFWFQILFKTVGIEVLNFFVNYVSSVSMYVCISARVYIYVYIYIYCFEVI